MFTTPAWLPDIRWVKGFHWLEVVSWKKMVSIISSCGSSFTQWYQKGWHAFVEILHVIGDPAWNERSLHKCASSLPLKGIYSIILAEVHLSPKKKHQFLSVGGSWYLDGWTSRKSCWRSGHQSRLHLYYNVVCGLSFSQSSMVFSGHSSFLPPQNWQLV